MLCPVSVSSNYHFVFSKSLLLSKLMDAMQYVSVIIVSSKHSELIYNMLRTLRFRRSRYIIFINPNNIIEAWYHSKKYPIESVCVLKHKKMNKPALSQNRIIISTMNQYRKSDWRNFIFVSNQFRYLFLQRDASLEICSKFHSLSSDELDSGPLTRISSLWYVLEVKVG